jgi:hypothetical protein
MFRFVSLILLLAFVAFPCLGCNKIEGLRKVMLHPRKEQSPIKPVESMDLAEAILWPQPYSLELQRDPFQPLSGTAAPLTPYKAKIDGESKIKVIGIAMKKNNPVALIRLPEGTFIFRQGNKVDQYILKKIEPKRLILEDEKTNQSLILKIGDEK